MPMRREVARILPLGLLVGCKPALDGAWSGSWECANSLVMDVDVALERVDAGTYGGQAVQRWSADWAVEDQQWSAWLELRSAWEVVADKAHGEQELELTVMPTGADCERSVDGQVETTDCTDLGIDAEGADPQMASRAWWDGADDLEAEVDFCGIGLVRVVEGG